ncbi:MAG TPA: hypothetical protein V6C85_07800 [Allocoleopsis sp.]
MLRLQCSTLTSVVLAATCILLPSISTAQNANSNKQITVKKVGVPYANIRQGHPPNVVVRGFQLKALAQGADRLENPSGVITKFGYLNDFPPQPVEATKTEPDENTYLVLDRNPGGSTFGYNYGRHFLFQGHENGQDFLFRPNGRYQCRLRQST